MSSPPPSQMDPRHVDGTRILLRQLSSTRQASEDFRSCASTVLLLHYTSCTLVCCVFFETQNGRVPVACHLKLPNKMVPSRKDTNIRLELSTRSRERAKTCGPLQDSSEDVQPAQATAGCQDVLILDLVTCRLPPVRNSACNLGRSTDFARIASSISGSRTWPLDLI